MCGVILPLMTQTNATLLTSVQVAQRLGVTRKTINRWIERGEFPNARRKSPVRKSNYLIPVADVVDFERRRDSQR